MLSQTCRGDDFRKDYSHLGMVCAAFPTAHVLALTATANIIDRKHIKESLCLKKCVEIVANPDRRNIFYEKYFREGQDVDAIERICRAIANDLLNNTINYPLTIVYLSLKWCGYVYKLFENVMGTNQYYPLGCPAKPKYRFA
jgi:superfamily II DNA helicase RecQ